jgi:hypothetical protein
MLVFVCGLVRKPLGRLANTCELNLETIRSLVEWGKPMWSAVDVMFHERLAILWAFVHKAGRKTRYRGSSADIGG